MERDGIAEEAARRRIDSQLSNKARVGKAHVILSTLWQPEETQKQVLYTMYMVMSFPPTLPRWRKLGCYWKHVCQNFNI